MKYTNDNIPENDMHHCNIDMQEQSHNIKCHAQLDMEHSGETVVTVRIQGTLKIDQPGQRVSMSIFFADVTGDPENPLEVYKHTRCLDKDSLKRFEYVCDLGVLNQSMVEMSDWLSVAKIKTPWLMLARKGNRKLRLLGTIICPDTNQVIANCSCLFDYDNTESGYLDLAENEERARALSVTLAFALCAADGHMYKCEIETIQQWAFKYVLPDIPRKKQWRLKWALFKTLRFFRKGNNINAAALACEIAKLTSDAQRYDIVELCLRQIESKGFISDQQLEMLKDIIAWLDVQQSQFRSMLEKHAPKVMSNINDPQIIFGLSNEMSKEQRRERLNAEYRKWNSRITSSDPNIHNQAEQMLTLIAEIHSQYVS